MITLFTCPKRFKDDAIINQTNAILSWKNLQFPVEILIFGNDEGVQEFCEKENLIQIKKVNTDKGIPLLDDIFYKAQKISKNNILVYLNADIILTNKFMQAILSIPKRNFFAIGQRTDITLNEFIDFNSNWEDFLYKIALENGELLIKTGMDYFVFLKGLFKELPPFYIGRTLWDPYLVFYAKEQGCELIDITHDAPVYHPRHDYSHANKTKEELWNSEEAMVNRKLCDGKIANITNCRYKLVNGKLIPKRNYEHD